MPSPRGRDVRRSRGRAPRLTIAAAALLALVAWPVASQAPAGQGAARGGDPYARGMQLEGADRPREAAAAYREALAADPAGVAALLGLERVYAQLGMTDSMLPVVERAIAVRPAEASLRTVQLRTLRALGDDARVRAAFERWRRDMPRDVAPFRELARLYLQDGNTAGADTLLRRAQAEMGSSRGVDMELAQLRAALGMWEPAAQAWRGAVDEQPWLERAATFSLTPTPAGAREAVGRTLLAPPVSVGARRIVAALRTEWGDPRAAWDALRVLRPDSAALAAWAEFATRAEEAQAWLVARDALLAVFAQNRSADVALRAASDALAGGDSRSALSLAGAIPDSGGAAMAALPVRLRALTALGRAEEAEALLAQMGTVLGAEARPRMARLVAWGWVRAGNLARARALLAGAGDDEDDPVYGWLALYEGDLRAARRLLKRQADALPDLVTALALLARVHADSAPAVGRAFLALARGDTASAIPAFEQAARETPDGAPLLLLTSARLRAARGDQPGAIALWRVIGADHAASPEAPEAELEWARALRRSGDAAGAVALLEHLILTFPQSALLPQARRELDLARASIPPSP